jgi:uncharacterized membrane protein YsdA (DUF1294 family)
MSAPNPTRRYGIPAFALTAVAAIVLSRRRPDVDLPTAWIVCMNLTAFLVFGLDKWLAGRQALRVPEKVLHAVALIGGLVGALLGMIVFRHKTSKRSFQWTLGALMAVEALLIALWFLGKFEGVGLASPL